MKGNDLSSPEYYLALLRLHILADRHQYYWLIACIKRYCLNSSIEIHLIFDVYEYFLSGVRTENASVT